MIALLIRALLSGMIVAAVSLLARKNPNLGGLIASIPLISTLGMIWLWRDTQDPVRVADYVSSAFWFFLPSMPMFLVIPAMLRSGINFWIALGAGCVVTILLYLAMIGLTARFGIRL